MNFCNSFCEYIHCNGIVSKTILLDCFLGGNLCNVCDAWKISGNMSFFWESKERAKSLYLVLIKADCCLNLELLSGLSQGGLRSWRLWLSLLPLTDRPITRLLILSATHRIKDMLAPASVQQLDPTNATNMSSSMEVASGRVFSFLYLIPVRGIRFFKSIHQSCLLK